MIDKELIDVQDVRQLTSTPINENWKQPWKKESKGDCNKN